MGNAMSKVTWQNSYFKEMVDFLKTCFGNLPDCRNGKNKYIEMKDVELSAFSVFFNQCASFLEHQRSMQKRIGKNNAASLFGIENIPSDNHARNLLDEASPSDIYPAFDFSLKCIIDNKKINHFKCLSNNLLMAVDGLNYFSSKKIFCHDCSTTKHKNGEMTYTHSMVSATLVSPHTTEVIPLVPEFIAPQDGREKQDCEREAFKRWLKLHGDKYSNLNITVLGDDLYACHPICTEVLAYKYNFIFTCKKDSHITLYEYIDYLENGDAIRLSEKQLDNKKKKKETYLCRYVNEVPIRDGKDALKVNWCEVKVIDSKGKEIYSGAFITSHTLTDDNVAATCQAGRSRWKTENEHNNTLKNHGYQLEHNFGHGKKHLSSVLATLIILSFLVHTTLALLDSRYHAIRNDLPRRMFFNQLRTLMFYMFFSSWNALMAYMMQGCELEYRDTG